MKNTLSSHSQTVQLSHQYVKIFQDSFSQCVSWCVLGCLGPSAAILAISEDVSGAGWCHALMSPTASAKYENTKDLKGSERSERSKDVQSPKMSKAINKQSQVRSSSYDWPAWSSSTTWAKHMNGNESISIKALWSSSDLLEQTHKDWTSALDTLDIFVRELTVQRSTLAYRNSCRRSTYPSGPKPIPINLTRRPCSRCSHTPAPRSAATPKQKKTYWSNPNQKALDKNI